MYDMLFVFCFIVLFCVVCVQMCTVKLTQGVNPIAVSQYIYLLTRRKQSRCYELQQLRETKFTVNCKKERQAAFTPVFPILKHNCLNWRVTFHRVCGMNSINDKFVGIW